MKYILSPEEYKLPNPRIDGFRKLKEVNARTVDVFVFSLEAFNYFLEHKKFPIEFVEELKKKAKEIIENSFLHKMVVRRAFVVPGIENPPGPYFLGLETAEEVIEAVEKLYRFAVSQDYHKDKQSQISGFMYPFIDPGKVDKINLDISKIPYGGYAIVRNDTVEIYAVFGNNEGVQSLVCDRYAVERERNRLFISKKEILQKNRMICTTIDSPSDLLAVPIEIQFSQVLSDSEVLEVARVLFELSEKYGPQRVEFTADEKGLIFNEVADYWKEAKVETGAAQVKGKVLGINNVSDLEKLKTIGAEKLERGEVVVLVGENIIINREYDVLGALSAWQDKLYVLYPGVAATQHAMRILADKGHKAFLVGMQKFKEGDNVQITTAGGKVRVTNLSRVESQEVISLWDASLFGNELCGGKANQLSLMKIAGFQVPHGLVISTVVFDGLLRFLEVSQPPETSLFKAIYGKLKKPPQEFVQKISSLLGDYIKSDKLFAVRSSATIEDTAKQSMAGMFETYLNVKGEELPEKVLKVIQSAFSKNISNYLLQQKELANNFKMAVVVQEMIPAKAAGVIFGADIRGRNADVVEIEANRGLGEGIVSGEAKEVEQFKFSRSEKRILTRKGPEILSQAEKKALFMLSERLRKEFNDIPQDIEWAIDKEDQIWVLQSRDLIY